MWNKIIQVIQLYIWIHLDFRSHLLLQRLYDAMRWQTDESDRVMRAE